MTLTLLLLAVVAIPLLLFMNYLVLRGIRHAAEATYMAAALTAGYVRHTIPDDKAAQVDRELHPFFRAIRIRRGTISAEEDRRWESMKPSAPSPN